MQRVLSFLLLLFLPAAAWADGGVIPPTALPVHVNIPDQRALICYSNGAERLVIETRFTAPGTNFAWVIPLPSQPVIEAATAGLFPTLQYLFRPEIVHNVSPYWLGILITLGLIYLLRLMAKYKSIGCAMISLFLLLFLASFLLPALSPATKKGMTSMAAEHNISILDRKLVGVFETTTITSRDPKALQNWLAENGYALPASAEPVIASYVQDGWVFVAAKIRRDRPDNATSTPHPLSFTFKTDKPVYPMRLTGVNSQSLSVELYVFGLSRAKHARFKLESCTRPDIKHPLLQQWTDGLPVATKLDATLSPPEMRQDVWLEQVPFLVEHKSHLFSRHGALTTALNWGAELFAAALIGICLMAFVSEKYKTKWSQLNGAAALISLTLVGLAYLGLPTIEVKLVRGGYYSDWRAEQFTLLLAWREETWQTLAETRAGFQELISNPTNAAAWGLKNWDNYFVGGRFREEDSPGNYLLRETNNQLQLIFVYPDGREEIAETRELPYQQ